MLFLKPSEIRFSQDSISNQFDPKSRHADMLIGETLDDLITGCTRVSDIPVISVLKMGDKWISADNRRLWVFKQLEKFGGNETVPVEVVSYIPEGKFTSKNGGLSVKIRSGRDPGGRYAFVIQVLEKVLNDHEAKIQKLKTALAENEDELNHLNGLVLELRNEKAKLRKECKDDKAKSEENIGELIHEYEKIVKRKDTELDALNEKLKTALTKLTKAEGALQHKDKMEELLSKYRTVNNMLEEKVGDLELQLSESRKISRKQTEEHISMKTTYIEKIRVLKSDYEIIRDSLNATENAENEAKINHFAEKLEREKERYRKLQRKTTQIHDSDVREIEHLEKKIETKKDKIESLKEKIHRKDKQMKEIRRLTVRLYDLVQNEDL